MTVPAAVAKSIPPGRGIYHNDGMFSISPAARCPQWKTT